MTFRGQQKLIGCVLAALMAASCAANKPTNDELPLTRALNTANESAEKTVAQFIEAYNAKDLNAMMALAHPDISWLSVEGNDISVMTDGAEATFVELAQYLGPDDNPRSDVEILKSHGNFVTTLERAYFVVDGEEKSQASFAMYEVVDGTNILRVWYFPSSE